MKIIAEQYYYALVDEILKEKLQESKSTKQAFVGLKDDELHAEIEKRLGKPWAIEVRKVTLSRQQVGDIANGQFYRETGRTLLLGLGIILLGLSLATRYINMTALFYNIYYTLCGGIGLGFIYVYSRKLKKIREDLKWKYGVRDSDGDK